MVEVGPVRVHRPSGPARIPPRFTRSGVLAVGVRAQVGVGGAGLAVAQVGQLDAVTGAMTADGGDQGLGTFDDLVVDLGDHVAVLESGLVGGAAVLHRAQLGSLGEGVAADIDHRHTEACVGGRLLVGDLVDD